jgi:hypothetical protein
VRPTTSAPTEPDPPGWVPWPFRVVALIVMLPLRLGWELAIAVRPALAPLARAWERLIHRPLAWALRVLVLIPLGWAWRTLVRLPCAWLVRHLVVIPLAMLAAVLAPGIRALGRQVYRWLLLPARLSLSWAASVVYRWILRPAGRAVAWAWRHTVVTAWRSVVAPARRWVRLVLRTGGGLSSRWTPPRG